MDALRTARRVLFDCFPIGGATADLVEFQESLVEEILTTEKELSSDRSPDRKWHLHLVRVYGDALAHTQLSIFALRQLSRNGGTPPQLTSQGKAFRLVMNCLRGIVERGAPAIASDLTHVLKNADLVVCVDRDSPTLVECKLSKASQVRFENWGRRGRQMARLRSIAAFLQNGHGQFFGEQHERVVIELSGEPLYDYRNVAKELAEALEGRPTTLVVPAGEILSAALLGKSAGPVRAEELPFRPGDHLVIGSSFDRLECPWAGVLPPILWELEPESRWNLMEGNVSVTRGVRGEALVGRALGDLRVAGIVETSDPLKWRYEVLVGEELVTLSPNLLLEVVNNYETLESAGVRLLESAAGAWQWIEGGN